MCPARSRYLALVIVSSLTLSGCALPFPGSGRTGPATPEQAVVEFYTRGKFSPPVLNHTILGSRIVGNRAVVFAMQTSTRRGQTSPTQEFVAHTAWKESWGWDSMGGDHDDRPGVFAPSLVCGSVAMGNDSGGSYTAVTGRVRLPDVAGIEVDFSSGDTITDTTADGLFAAIVPRADPPDELRLLDDKGRVIHTAIPPVMQVRPPPPTPVQRSQQGGMTVELSTMQTDFRTIECSP